MTLHFEAYWSFRSPYCYILADRLHRFVQTHDVVCAFRPIYPAVIRNPGFFEAADPRWFSYFRLDIKRSAEFAGLPLRWPRPDPVAVDSATGRALDEQTLIRSLTRLGVLADKGGRGTHLAVALGALMWSGEVDDWHCGDHLKRACVDAGLPPTVLERAIASQTDELDRVIEENERQHAAAGHWGVPLLVVDGEPFFGQDRFDMFVWRLQQKGLSSDSVSRDATS